VTRSFSVAHDDLVAHELDVFHAQAHGFHDAHPGAVQERADERMHARQPGEDPSDLLAGQHNWQSRRRLRAFDAIEPRKLDPKDLLVQEQERGLGLVLGRGRNVLVHRQRGQESLDVGGPELGRVPLAMEQDEAFNPLAICLLCANAVVLARDPIANQAQQCPRRTRRNSLHQIRRKRPESPTDSMDFEDIPSSVLSAIWPRQGQ